MSVVKFEYDAATAVNGYKTYQITLSDYGIRAGQRVGIICIGGGGAGGGVTDYDSGSGVRKGGDAGKHGVNGGGGGYGYGAGGGGATGISYAVDYWNPETTLTRYIGAGGGGSGYLASDVITVTDAIAAATIVVSVGKGGTGGYTTGADGNPTSFGTYVTANGGVGGGGGNGGSSISQTLAYPGGAGRANGGNGYSSGTSNIGGGGAGGFIIGQPIAGNGENGNAGGRGGGITTGGGALYGQDGSDGHGVCFMIWED